MPSPVTVAQVGYLKVRTGLGYRELVTEIFRIKTFKTSIHQENEETRQSYPLLAAAKRKIIIVNTPWVSFMKTFYFVLFGNSSPNLDVFIHNFCLQFTFGNE